MRQITFSKPAKYLIRFFCVNGIIVELLRILFLLLHTDFNLGIPEITNFSTFLTSDLLIFIVNAVSFIFFIVLLFVPKFISFFAIISFLYSIKIIIVDTLAANPFGQLLYFIGISCLLFLGHYHKHRLIKIVSSILFNMLLIATNARFGAMICIKSYIVSLGYSLALLVIVFFTTNFLRLVHDKKTARIWDLSKFPELTLRDKEWLKQILEEKKYEEIANESGVTVGTLKNRMHWIFNVVGISDRIDLISTYSGYEVRF